MTLIHFLYKNIYKFEVVTEAELDNRIYQHSKVIRKNLYGEVALW